MNYRRGSALPIFLILIVVGIVLIGLGLKVNLSKFIKSNPLPTQTLSPTPTPDPTANWKMYKNEKYGFGFKYPENWRITNDTTTKGEIEFYDDTKKIKISFRKNANQKTLNELWKEKSCYGDKPFVFCSSNFTDIRTITAINTQIYWHIGEDKIATAFIPKLAESLIIEITTYSPVDNQTFDQILSTFKFLDNETEYTCPKGGWVNCMPILTEEAKKACSSQALEWYKKNCPNFKGVAQ